MAKRNPYPGVYALPGGGFRYMVREPQPDGSERQRWYSLNAAGERYSSRKEAHDARVQHLARIANPTPEWSRDSLGAFLTSWVAGQASVRASTHVSYEGIVRIRILPHIGSVPLAGLTPAHIRAWHQQLAGRYKPGTINTTHNVLTGALNDAVDWDLIPRNPAARVTPPRPAPEIPAPWSADEVRAFLIASAGHRHEVAFRLLLSSGMRTGELLALRWRDIDWSGRQATIQRTTTRNRDKQFVIGDLAKSAASRRTIPLTDQTVALLRAHQDRQAFTRRMAGDTWQDNDLILCSRRGTRLSAMTLPEQFQQLVATVTLPDGKALRRIRPHDLRHTAATLMLVRGTPVHVVARILGHATPAITLNRYAHYLPAYGRDAIDDLERLFGSG